MPPFAVVMLCPAGFEDVVAMAARSELPKFAEQSRSGGLVQGQTVASIRQLRGFSCATNVFQVLHRVPRSTVENELRQVLIDLPGAARPIGMPMRGTFRLRIHNDGQFESTSDALARRLELHLASWTGLFASRRAGGLEIWLIRRTREAESILAAKLTAGVQRRAPGVLRPEICAALARVEPLRGRELVLDPFAGSGAIGQACVDAGAQQVWLNDVRSGARARPASARIVWTARDFRSIGATPGSVSAVVTDPPWGHYPAGDQDVDRLYTDLGAAAASWLEPGGAVVLLTGTHDGNVEHFLRAGELACELDLAVLVNGHKARVLRARKAKAPYGISI